MKVKFFLIITIFFLPFTGFTQQAKNVKAIFDGEIVTRTYNLSEKKTGTTFDVNVKCFDFYDNEIAMYSKSGDI